MSDTEQTPPAPPTVEELRKARTDKINNVAGTDPVGLTRTARAADPHTAGDDDIGKLRKTRQTRNTR